MGVSFSSEVLAEGDSDTVTLTRDGKSAGSQSFDLNRAVIPESRSDIRNPFNA